MYNVLTANFLMTLFEAGVNLKGLVEVDEDGTEREILEIYPDPWAKVQEERMIISYMRRMEEDGEEDFRCELKDFGLVRKVLGIRVRRTLKNHPTNITILSTSF